MKKNNQNFINVVYIVAFAVFLCFGAYFSIDFVKQVGDSEVFFIDASFVFTLFLVIAGIVDFILNFWKVGKQIMTGIVFGFVGMILLFNVFAMIGMDEMLVPTFRTFSTYIFMMLIMYAGLNIASYFTKFTENNGVSNKISKIEKLKADIERLKSEIGE